MRRLLAALAVVAGIGVALPSIVSSAADDPYPLPDPDDPITQVHAGEGLWQTAKRECQSDFTNYYQALQQMNPWYTGGVQPGTVLHRPSCPVVYKRPTTTTTTTAPSTTTSTSSTTSSTVVATTTSSTVAPTTSTTSAPPSSTTSSTSTSTTVRPTTTTSTTLPPTTTTRPATTTTAPPSGTFPNASTTGPTGTLTAYTGPLYITAANTVIDHKTINGCVTVAAPGVIIRNSRIACNGGYVIDAYPTRTPWLLLEDVEVVCTSTFGTGIGEEGVTVRRADIYGCVNGFDVNGNMLVEDSYIHDLYTGNDAHSDGAQINAGGSNITFRHNTMISRGPAGDNGTSAIISHPTSGANVLYTGNLFGGGAYTLYCPRDTSTVQVTNNVWSTSQPGEFGPTDECGHAAVWSNNRWDDGRPVPAD